MYKGFTIYENNKAQKNWSADLEDKSAALQSCGYTALAAQHFLSLLPTNTKPKFTEQSKLTLWLVPLIKFMRVTE